MFSHVIFDLDGTLLNTLDDLTDAGNWVCRNHGWPTHSAEEFKRFVGNGLTKQVERFTPPEISDPGEIGALVEEFSAFYNVHKADKTAPYPGLPQMLARLKAAGISMAVLTNKEHRMAADVVEHYYPGVFPTVQGSLSDTPAKPEPTLLYQLMERMGAEKEHTLFVGDSNVDIRTAKNGGLISCGVLWGFRSRQELAEEGADHFVQTPAELAELILR